MSVPEREDASGRLPPQDLDAEQSVLGAMLLSEAAVAEATAGFDIELHMPKGGMFTNGLLSLIFAHGVMPVTLFAGRTTNVLGATPKLHWSIAPMVT